MDLVGLTLLDPETGKTETVESDPLKRVDFGGVIFSEVTDELVADHRIWTTSSDAISRTKTLRADYKWLQEQVAGQGDGARLAHPRRTNVGGHRVQ